MTPTPLESPLEEAPGLARTEPQGSGGDRKGGGGARPLTAVSRQLPVLGGLRGQQLSTVTQPQTSVDGSVRTGPEKDGRRQDEGLVGQEQ